MLKHIHFISYGLIAVIASTIWLDIRPCFGVHTNDHFIRLTEHLCRSSKIDIMLSTLHMIVFTLSSLRNPDASEWRQTERDREKQNRSIAYIRNVAHIFFCFVALQLSVLSLVFICSLVIFRSAYKLLLFACRFFVVFSVIPFRNTKIEPLYSGTWFYLIVSAMRITVVIVRLAFACAVCNREHWINVTTKLSVKCIWINAQFQNSKNDCFPFSTERIWICVESWYKNKWKEYPRNEPTI